MWGFESLCPCQFCFAGFWFLRGGHLRRNWQLATGNCELVMTVSATAEHDSQGQNKVKDLSARLKSFYSDVRSEMKKVTAPSWKEVQGTTIVVLITVAVFGVFFFVVDEFLQWFVNQIIVHFSH